LRGDIKTYPKLGLKVDRKDFPKVGLKMDRGAKRSCKLIEFPIGCLSRQRNELVGFEVGNII
jgi:hypothetical protein